jgi:hypothetical protein
MKAYLSGLASMGALDRPQLMQEEVLLHLSQDRFDSLLTQLRKGLLRGFLVTSVLEFDSIVIVNVVLEPACS